MLDRALQRDLLTRLRDVYPNRLEWSDDANDDDPAEIFNVHYLHEHGLIQAEFAGGESYVQLMLCTARITAAGLDFLAEDGGLGAILRVVTVRLEAESIKALIAARIDETDAPPGEKSALKEHLRTLPEVALKAGTQELVKEGLKHLPAAIPWLRTLVGL